MSNVPIWPSALVHGQPDMMAGKQIEMPPTGLGITNDLANQQTIAPHRFTHQPDLYLQLSQILECEISNHIQTRAELLAETTRRSELENQVWKQLQDISEWQNACQTVYSSLDQHRAEAARLKLELDVANAELATLKVCISSNLLHPVDILPCWHKFLIFGALGICYKFIGNQYVFPKIRAVFAKC